MDYLEQQETRKDGRGTSKLLVSKSVLVKSFQGTHQLSPFKLYFCPQNRTSKTDKSADDNFF